MWNNQKGIESADRQLEAAIEATKNRQSSTRLLTQYVARLSEERPTIATGPSSGGGGSHADKVAKLRALGLWKEVPVAPENLRTEAERLGGIVSKNDMGEDILLVPKQFGPRQAAKLWKTVQGDPDLYSDSALVEHVDEMVNDFGRGRLWDALSRRWDIQDLPQKQMTVAGKRYQYKRLPQEETVIGDGKEYKLGRDDAITAFSGKPIQLFDPGMDPKKLERTLDFAKVPTKNGVPVPWQEMTATEQASLSGQLRSYPNLSLDEQEALETIAKSVPGLPESLMEFRGHRAGLDLMARDKGNDMPFLSLRGTGLGLPGISLNYSPRSMFGRLYNPLNAASNNRTAPLGLTGAASDVTNELMEARKRKASTKDKR